MRRKPLVRFAIPFIFLLTVSALVPSTRGGATQGGPTLLKRTVAVSSKRFLRYWPNPSAAEPKYNTWSWTPQISFQILGPVPGGSQWMFEASTPDGKAWVSYKLRTDEVRNDELVTIKGPDLDENELEKKAITQTGLFPFKITLKNALAGTTPPCSKASSKSQPTRRIRRFLNTKANRNSMSRRIGACRLVSSGTIRPSMKTFQ
jgi:hypothetical protein